MVDPTDAANVAVPFALLASKDEDAAAVENFVKGLKVESFSETYSDMIHVSAGLRSLVDSEINVR